MQEALTYDDVLLLPQYSDIRSRSEVDISTDLGRGLELTLPIISSPMDTISEDLMAGAMSNAGGIMMREVLASIRREFGQDLHIMAGNVATLEGINHLADWGADSVRCNIGGGSICSTRVQTGHGHPGLQTIMDCARTHRDVTIIADGGIRNSGDIVKALAAGADAVMLGSLLAGTKETPGETLTDGLGKKFKTYRGMASKEAQMDWRGRYSSHEGVSATVPYRGKVKNVLEDLERGIRSGLSYSGCRSIREMQHRAQFVRQTPAGLGESKTHILSRGV